MIRSTIWSAILFFFFGCNDDPSDSGKDKGGGSENDSAEENTDNSGSEGNTDSSGSEGDGDLWAAAWSILGTRCGSAGACHNRASGGQAGLNLPADDEAAAMANAEDSKERIRSAVTSGIMPQGDTLSAEERAKVTDWIDSL